MTAPPLGAWGEELAARHLERQGWTIAARNYRVGRKEIDLVAMRGEVVAFVEVKTRSGEALGHPLEAVTPRKRAEIASVAAGWLERHGRDSLVCRFDAIAILPGPDGEPVVTHLEDAWGV